MLFLECINKDTDDERMNCILNELSLNDWVPEIKLFISNLTTDPTELRNMTSGGAKSSKVYTVVEKCEDGYVAFVGNRWFKVTENEIKEADLTESFKDEELSKLYNLQKSNGSILF